MQVLCMGEALIDMLSNKGQPGIDDSNESFRKFAGGAPANVAVAVAKLGGNSALLGKLGNDQFGHYLMKTLADLGVTTTFTTYSDAGKTALAFVGLDADGERSFDFYIDNAAHTDLHPGDLVPALFDTPRIVSFCSGSVCIPRLRTVTAEAIAKFKSAGSILTLDINLRPAFWDDSSLAPTTIADLAGQVDIIKASKEELIELYGEAETPNKIAQWLKQGVSLVLITNGAEPITFYTNTTNGTYTHPAAVKAVDTTAAGDAFVGGFLFQLAGQVHHHDELSNWLANQDAVTNALRFATACGAHAVSHFGAFEALPTAKDIQ
ncbi:carbohydrate kinase family protein [Alteromonas gilva]|uniref:Carbohydrate kinase n=1 Tax=Alteromonas gilva TaxID=2987522 RepID=A0ABT5L3B6_9ALTE|nr:carbohydrate kinase [Alteromonas gilva]MDC8830273.1 carbohydrate kinase [Alteromonas gilva]